MQTVLATILSILAALVTASFLLWMMAANPWPILGTIIYGGFGSWFGLSETLVKAIPILLCALAVAVPAWVGLMNIGAEGQFYIGALAAAGVALFFPAQSAFVLLPAMLIAAFIAGGLWAGAAGVLRAKLEVNEVMVTLMSNFVAILLVTYLVHGIWKDPGSRGWPQSAEFVSTAVLPKIGDSRVHFGLLIAVAATLILYAARNFTHWGLTTRLILANPRTAQYAGISVKFHFIVAMIIGGGLAALAGATEVSAIHGRLRPDLSPGYGYTGILVSWMAGHHPLAIMVAAFFIAGLLAGGDNLQIDLKLPFATVNMVLGLTFFFLLLSQHVFPKQAGQRS